MKIFPLSKWTIVGIMLVTLSLSVAFGVLFWMNRPLRPAASPAVVTLINGPTSTPLVTATATVNPLFVPTATAQPGAFMPNDYVQIKGTEGVGLRVRSDPGLGSTQLFLAYDSEVFQVKEGPIEKDNYTWWYLVAPYDATRAGWAVQDYLNYIPSP
jgi:hypothetical protein